MDVIVTPLPENSFATRASSAAYNRCRTLEAAINVLHVDGYPPTVCGRLLGHLFRLAPPRPRAKLQHEITECRDDAKLMALAIFYLNCFIRPFKGNGEPTPALSDHLSCTDEDDDAMVMDATELVHYTAHESAMRRDNNRCMLTGFLDLDQPRGALVVQTAHIIPAPTDTNISAFGGKGSQSENMWSILTMFSEDNIIEDLAGNRIHRLENLLSLNIVAHHLFDELWLRLKPTNDAPHRYRVCTAKDREFAPPLPEFVTFTTDTELPLPNPEYLALHALCSEVVWISGAEEYIMEAC